MRLWWWSIIVLIIWWYFFLQKYRVVVEGNSFVCFWGQINSYFFKKMSRNNSYFSLQNFLWEFFFNKLGRTRNIWCVLCIYIIDQTNLDDCNNKQVLPIHSSEIRGLCLMKSPREMLQNLLYLVYKKTQGCFFRFSFHVMLLYFLP